MVFQLKNETIVIDKIGGLFSHNKIPLKKKKIPAIFKLKGLVANTCLELPLVGTELFLEIVTKLALLLRDKILSPLIQKPLNIHSPESSAFFFLFL